MVGINIVLFCIFVSTLCLVCKKWSKVTVPDYDKTIFIKLIRQKYVFMLSLAAFFTKSEGVFLWDNLDQD